MNNNFRPRQYASGINLIAGLWLLLAGTALVFSNPNSPVTNDFVVGILVVCFSLWHILKPETHLPSWLNVALGGWLLAAPSTLHYAFAGHVWSDVIAGVFLIVFGTLAALVKVPPKQTQVPHPG